jgi:hypothetical protein
MRAGRNECFTVRDDLLYRNRALQTLTRIDT